MIRPKVGFTNPPPVIVPTYVSTVKHLVKSDYNGTINKGQAVYVTGSTGLSGTNMLVNRASNGIEMTSSKTMGLLETSLTKNDIGYVITEGLLSGIDTSAAGSAGDPVWLGIDGNLIYGLTNKPVAPAHLVFIGIVTRKQQNNGEIFVKVQNGFEVEELHNVVLTGKAAGDTIVWNGGTWVNRNINGATGSFTANDKTITVTNGIITSIV